MSEAKRELIKSMACEAKSVKPVLNPRYNKKHVDDDFTKSMQLLQDAFTLACDEVAK